MVSGTIWEGKFEASWEYGFRRIKRYHSGDGSAWSSHRTAFELHKCRLFTDHGEVTTVWAYVKANPGMKEVWMRFLNSKGLEKNHEYNAETGVILHSQWSSSESEGDDVRHATRYTRGPPASLYSASPQSNGIRIEWTVTTEIRLDIWTRAADGTTDQERKNF